MMLNAWHLPVPPFVKQSKDQLLITLWLTGEDPPQRIMLRTEHDNEEMSVPMHKQRSQPQPGVTAWRAAIDLSSGQPRRRYSFKLLWHDRQRWFTPQGFSRMPPARQYNSSLLLHKSDSNRPDISRGLHNSEHCPHLEKRANSHLSHPD